MATMFYRAAGAILAPFRYAEREARMLKEHVKEDIQAYISIALKLLLAGIAAMMFLLFVSIAVANWINAAMNSSIAGYAIVAGFYLFIAAIMYALKQADNKKQKETLRQRREE